MKSIITLLLFTISYYVQAQITYSGFLGKYPIQLVLEIYGDDVAYGMYVYDKYDNPIWLQGKRNGKILELRELNERNEITAVFRFENCNPSASSLEGKWKDQKTGKSLMIRLKKVFDAEEEQEGPWAGKELLQLASTRHHYFKLLLAKPEASDFVQVSGVKVYEKGSDRLLQQIELDCQFQGFRNVSVGDYNFDGLEDFSVFEASYAGPNTTRLYLLYEPASQNYRLSNIQGVSLEFDAASKTIHETNQCCAGTIITSATYKLVENEMVLLERHCFRWSEESDELEEREFSACQ